MPENTMLQDLLRSDRTYKYMILSRLKMDCNYYLGNGGRNKKHLWAQDEKAQIDTMKGLWNNFGEEDKPEWLTWEEILDFEAKMIE